MENIKVKEIINTTVINIKGNDVTKISFRDGQDRPCETFSKIVVGDEFEAEVTFNQDYEVYRVKRAKKPFTPYSGQQKSTDSTSMLMAYAKDLVVAEMQNNTLKGDDPDYQTNFKNWCEVMFEIYNKNKS